MNIDLFQSKSDKCGLISHGMFTEPPAGALFDAQIMEMTLEFVNSDPVHMNINVDFAMRDVLLESNSIYFGVISNGTITESLTTPLMILNDPFEADTTVHNLDKSLQTKPQTQTMRSVLGFDGFMKESRFAQAIHRDDLENEAEIKSVMQGQNLQSLTYAAPLERSKKLEATADYVAAPITTPQMGLGANASSSAQPKNNHPPPSSKDISDDT
jgi:hypothetical protein